MMRIIGITVFGLLLASAAVISDTGDRPASFRAVPSQSTEIIIELDSLEVPAASPGAWLSIYLTNTLQSVGAFDLTLQLDGESLFKFPVDSVVDTIITCIDTVDCNPADTSIDTVPKAQVDLAGGAITEWEYVEGRAHSTILFKFVGLADGVGGPSVPPLSPTGTPRLLGKVWMENNVADPQILDTLTARTAFINALPPNVPDGSVCSDPDGDAIGRWDSAICLNPPTCDSFEFRGGWYEDAYVMVRGARTFGPACLKGDVNNNGAINAADIIYLVGFVFKGGPAPLCSPTGGDVNCSGTTNAADIIYLVGYVFKGGPAPLQC
jgi:hypothetical protein